MMVDSDSASLLLPGWDIIQRDFIEPGIPGRVIVRSKPKVELFVDLCGTRFGALFALPAVAAAPASPFTDIEIVEVRVDGQRCLEVSTRTLKLFGTFYLFLVDVARAVIDRSTVPTKALEASLAQWRALLQTTALLSDERQLGLAGELWMLERLLASLGSAGLHAWVGPEAQPHDFRIGDLEFEVKSTSGTRRVHTINGLPQLAPTMGAELYILSLRFTDAGAGGETLSETVERVVSLVAPGDQQRLGNKLAAVGFRAADAVHYTRRRRLADRPRLIRITDGVPRLTSEALEAMPKRFVPTAIKDVTYRIDVEGMGFEEGTPAFSAVLPNS